MKRTIVLDVNSRNSLFELSLYTLRRYHLEFFRQSLHVFVLSMDGHGYERYFSLEIVRKPGFVSLFLLFIYNSGCLTIHADISDDSL